MQNNSLIYQICGLSRVRKVLILKSALVTKTTTHWWEILCCLNLECLEIVRIIDFHLLEHITQKVEWGDKEAWWQIFKQILAAYLCLKFMCVIVWTHSRLWVKTTSSPAPFQLETDELSFVSVYLCSGSYTSLHKLDSSIILFQSFSRLTFQRDHLLTKSTNMWGLISSTLFSLLTAQLAFHRSLSNRSESFVGSFFPCSSTSSSWVRWNRQQATCTVRWPRIRYWLARRVVNCLLTESY